MLSLLCILQLWNEAILFCLELIEVLFWEWSAKNLLTSVWVIELVNDGYLP